MIDDDDRGVWIGAELLILAFGLGMILGAAVSLILVLILG